MIVGARLLGEVQELLRLARLSGQRRDRLDAALALGAEIREVRAELPAPLQRQRQHGRDHHGVGASEAPCVRHRRRADLHNGTHGWRAERRGLLQRSAAHTEARDSKEPSMTVACVSVVGAGASHRCVLLR